MKHLKNCPICSSVDFSNYLSTKDYFFTMESFNISTCNSCGFIFTNPIPKNLKSYYDTKEYLSHNSNKSGIIDSVYRLVRKINIKKKYTLLTKYKTNGSILDIGCGTGDLLAFFKNKGWSTLGIEPNTAASEIARTKYRLNIYDESYISEIEDKSFDIITMWHVLEHVEELNQRIISVKTKLKDNGFAFIAVPNIESYDAAYYKEYWAGLDVPRHLYHFSKSSINKLISKHQLVLIDQIPMRFDSYYVSMLSEKYLNTNVPIIRAMWRGWLSNIKAKRQNNYSSMIFVLKKNI